VVLAFICSSFNIIVVTTMRAKSLTHEQNFSERALTNTKVIPLDRTSTNNLIEYFNDSHYLDSNVDPNQITIKQNVQTRQFQIAVVSQAENKTNIRILKLSLTILILIFIVGIYSVSASLSNLQKTNTTQANSNSELIESTLLKRQFIASRLEYSNPNYLQSMAINIMQDEHWDVQKVHYFKLSWNRLELEQQNETRNQVWFQLFENTLIRELNGYIKHVDSYDYNTVLRERALVSLAKSINIQAPSTSSQQPIQLASLGEINNVTLGVAQPPQEERNQLSKPTEKELDTITSQFVNSYELGDIKQFISLFSKNVVSNLHGNITGLKEQYAEVFKNTVDRQMILHDVKWKFRKGKAIGKAKAEISLASNKSSLKKERLSRLQLVAEKQHDKVVFSRFYLLNE